MASRFSALGQRDFGGAQHGVAGDQLQAARADGDGAGDVARGALGAGDEQVADGGLDVVDVEDAGGDGEAALGVEIDQQDALAHLAERRAEVERAGGLADAAFLVRDRDDGHM